MTAVDFCQWLAEMKASGLARSDADCYRLLGVSKNTMLAYKRRGTDTSTALACRALFHGLGPYGLA